ncbi:hypothetical protein NDU88_010818 [Pleurodeles waltl]|uniref:Uncharacterized protein n=1 Tax=Pleurodeles waltl TaxID=8319 RepID=A0AAV7S0Q5_PLEWA|nr:hypothetical protein NDU88_010818 [Pleurodeles waltl]
MEALKTFGFSDEECNNLIGHSSNKDKRLAMTIVNNSEWRRLLNLKKKAKRTEAHTQFMLEYLMAGVIRSGLRVRNVPALFVEIQKFLEKLCQIAKRCARDWMILIVETAKEVVVVLNQEMLELEEKLRCMNKLEEAKKKLEEINAELHDFEDYWMKKKTDKLKKDTRWYTQEKAYLYLISNYYQE